MSVLLSYGSKFASNLCNLDKFQVTIIYDNVKVGDASHLNFPILTSIALLISLHIP